MFLFLIIYSSEKKNIQSQNAYNQTQEHKYINSKRKPRHFTHPENLLNDRKKHEEKMRIRQQC